MESSSHRILRQNKPFITCLLLLILSVTMILKAQAYMTRTIEKHNELTVGYCDIELDTTGGVSVKNTGSYPCFIRVALDNAPEPDDKVWEKSGGFYYYKDAVAPGESTPDLFADPAQSPGLSVYAEAIDALGTGDALTAWTEFLSGGDDT